ncbi:MAG: metal ABC transporter permease [Sedimentisphaerales bacterium]|nr:metal ABC transporter permease [Sedimentisphaerales bacterium]
MTIDFQLIYEEIYVAVFLCLMIGTIMGYLGTHVLKRGIVFIDISLAQFAAIGAVLAGHVFYDHGHSHGHGHEYEPLAYFCSISAVILVAIFYSVVHKYKKNISLEAIIGVTYAIGFATAVFIISVCGSQELHAESFAGNLNAIMGFGSIAPCMMAYGVVAICALLFHKPLTRISDNYDSKKEGIYVIFWDILFYTMMGVAISYSIVHIGVVMVFVYLVIPAVTASLFTDKLSFQMPIIILAVAVASIIGLSVPYIAYDSWELELSTGPHVGLILGLILIVAVLVKVVASHIIRSKG